MSPPHPPARILRTIVLLAAWAALLPAQPIPCHASATATVDERMPVTDGLVLGCAQSGDTVYVSGYFNSIGPASGAGVPLDRRTGEPVSRYPKVAGSVAVVISDQMGGWFIGGNFSGVGGEPHRNLAHVLANGRVAIWAPDPDAPVATLALDGKTLYVGGSFTTIAGKSRRSVAAFDIRTGEARPWDPSADAGVTAIIATPSAVFVGGWFDSIGGQPRTYLAALDAVSGKATQWRVDANGAVSAFAEQDEVLYVGGEFTRIGGQHRQSLAAVDIATASVTAWSADVENRARERDPFVRINQLATSENYLLVAGRFTHASGVPRGGVAELDLRSGSATTWNPNPVDIPHTGFAPWILAMAVRGRTVYLGGGFNALGGTPRSRCGAVDVVTGMATSWTPRLNTWPTSFAVDGARVYAGGSFSLAGRDWKERFGLAAFDAGTGAVLDWNPQPDHLPLKVAIGAGSVFVAGDFSRISGEPRDGVAVFDQATGALRSWAPNFGRYSRTLVADDRQVVICRDEFVTAYDASDGDSLWSVRTNDVTWALAMDGSRLYVGGWFSKIAGLDRFSGAELDATTGTPLEWNPQQPDVIQQLVSAGGNVFASGWFLPDGQVAAFDATTGENRWRAYANSNTFSVAATGSHVFVGGVFSEINGASRNGLAALDPISGGLTDWDLDLDQGPVWTLYVKDDRLYVGGYFQRAGLSPATNFAVVPLTRASPIRGRKAAVMAIDAQAFGLAPAVPNPVRERATIAFTLPSSGEVSIVVFDLQGRRVASPIDHAMRQAGRWSVNVVTRGWSPGCYLYRLEFGGRSLVRKMLVVP